jgi:hypothetical protein
MLRCPDCHTEQVIKNGAIHTGKPNDAGNACGRHCVQDPVFRIISDDTKALIDRLLLEKSPWRALPALSRCQCAVASNDVWDAYASILPSKRHRAVGKASGPTNHIEHLKTTVRQRIGRLVRLVFRSSRYCIPGIGPYHDCLGTTKIRTYHAAAGENRVLVWHQSEGNDAFTIAGRN